MGKIVIIGPSGAGKTTLAKNLGAILKMKVYHLDRFFWLRGWEKKDRDERIDKLQKLVLEKQWIIEGSYLNSYSSKIYLKAADTIIFLDLASFLCLQRIFKRHQEYKGRSRRDIPEGCTDKLTLFLMLKVLLFPLREHKKLEKKLRIYESGNRETKQVIRLHSDEEIEAFLAKLRNGSSENNTPVEERTLAVAGR
jgi:adenylate kinase family enzyme